MNKFAIICSGQGALGVDTFSFSKSHVNGRAVIDKFTQEFGWNLLLVEGGEIDFRLNKFAQPLTIAAALANWEVLKSLIPTPSFVAGYSAGEVAAWGCSGALDFSWAAKLSYLRCSAMEKFSPSASGMLAVKGLAQCELLKYINGKNTYIAIYNEDDHFVVGGPNQKLEYLEEHVRKHGAWCKRLPVSVPSHTSWLKDASMQVLADFKDLDFPRRNIVAPVIQGIDGGVCKNLNSGMDMLARAISEPINWQLCMQTLVDSGVTVALELGPGNALAKMIAEVHPSISARSVMDFRTPEGVNQWILRELER